LISLSTATLILFCGGYGQKPDNSNDGQIIVGRGYSFVLKEPKGWVIKSDKNSQVQAAIVPESSSWENSTTVMYARVIKKDEEQPTVEKVIQTDIDDFLKQNSQSTVSDSPELLTKTSKKAIVKSFYDAANKNYESVAFIDEQNIVVILALSSRNKAEYEKSLPAFKSLVASYFFFMALDECCPQTVKPPLKI
jgi:hypothetical protein